MELWELMQAATRSAFGAASGAASGAESGAKRAGSDPTGEGDKGK